MTIDCSFNWQEIRRIGGPCIKPGGSILTERALEVCDLIPGSCLADIGCGVGETLKNLERTGVFRSVGLDCSEVLLGEALPKLGSGRLVRGQAEILPFKKDSFDALFCECVLSILADRIAAFHEFTRVLKEGGFLIISDVFRQTSPKQGPLDKEPQQLRTEGLLAKENLLDLLAKHSFSLLLWEEHKKLLKEFVARMILAGAGLTYPWECRQGQKKTDRAGVSYFLLVARKHGTVFRSVRNKGADQSWTT
jgi:arsenite methyltransferase